jgi:Tfp pilus assembly protein PilP
MVRVLKNYKMGGKRTAFFFEEGKEPTEQQQQGKARPPPATTLPLEHYPMHYLQVVTNLGSKNQSFQGV